MMSRNGEVDNERSKAAAWVWYQRGASSSYAQQSGDLMKRSRRSSSSRNEIAEEMMASRRITPQPSRFKREAAAAHNYDHSLQATPPFPAAPPHDQHVDDHSHPAATTYTHSLQNPILRSSEPSPQRSPAACRNYHFSPISSGTQHAALDHYAQCGAWRSPALQRRKSESSPRPVRDHWTDKLFGIRRRKSFSSLHSGADSLRRVRSTDLEPDSSRAAQSCSPKRSGDATASAAAVNSPNRMSSLLDSFELHAILKKLGYEADDDDFEERTLRSLEETMQVVLGNDHHNDCLSSSPTHCKQSLYDLLGWSERGLNIKGGSCTSSDHYYHVESPEINIGSSSSAKAGAAQVRQRRRHRRPSIFTPHLPHSFSNALHHMHLPHLPHSFSTALHHLPHSFSNALHHLPHLPHSVSNALHQITHSLSSAYHHLHTASHRQNTNDSGAHCFHTDDAAPNTHHIDVATSPHHHTASPHHHTHAHRHLIPAHLRHLLSFKTHHSPPHPSCTPTFDSLSQAANYHINPTAALVQHSLKSFPSFNQHMSKSDDYMLIYSSAKKHSNHGSGHHHHHRHYHHHHYVL